MSIADNDKPGRPQPIVLSIGIAFIFLATASTHMPAVQEVYMVSPLFNSMNLASAIALLVPLIACYRKGRYAFLRHPVLVGAMGAAASASAVVLFSGMVSSQGVSFLTARLIYRVVVPLIALVWGESIICKGWARKTVLLVIAAALALCGLVEVLTSFLLTPAIRVMVILFPAISVAIYLLTRPAAEVGRGSGVAQDAEKLDDVHASRIPLHNLGSGAIALFFFMIVILFINYHWYPYQDLAMNSRLIQTAAGVGVLLASLLFLVCARWFWQGSFITAARTLMVILATIALYLTTFLEGSWAMFFVIPSKACECLCILFVFSAASNTERRRLMNVCICLIAYRLAQFVSMAISSWFGNTSSALVFPTLIVMVVLALGVQIIVMSLESSTKTILIVETPEKDYSSFAVRFGLTERELHILSLLAQGRSSSYIADKLALANSTVRNHISSIYSKLGIHSKQELLDMLETDEHAEKN